MQQGCLSFINLLFWLGQLIFLHDELKYIVVRITCEYYKSAIFAS